MALKRPSLVSLVKTEASFVASTLKRWPAGPDRPIFSIAPIPAFTRGDSSPAAADP